MDVGLVVEGAVGGPVLEQWAQVLGIREPVFLAIMRSIINGSRDASFPAQITTGLGSADLWAAHDRPQPYYMNDPRFGGLAIRMSEVSASTGSSGEAQTSASLSSVLAGAATLDRAGDLVADALQRKTAEILQMPTSEVDPSLPLYKYGIDSLTAIELRNWIVRETKVNIALLEIMAAVPIKDLALKIAQKRQSS